MFDEEIKTFILNFLIGGTLAAISKTITAPADRIKVILQNQNSAYQVLTGKTDKYTGIIDVIRRIPTEQGYLSYWRGNATNVIRYFPTQALNFSFNDVYRELFFTFYANNTTTTIIVGKFFAGALAGITSTSLLYPLDFCQTRLAADVGSNRIIGQPKREFRGLSECVCKVYANAGFTGFYSGLKVGVVGIALYRSLYFGLFDTVKHFVAGKPLSDQEQIYLPLLTSIFIAQGVTTVCGLASYPFDTVARRLMLDSGRPEHLKQFKNNLEAFHIIYNTEGVRGFYRGALMNVARCLGGALVLVMYDTFLFYTDWKNRIK